MIKIAVDEITERLRYTFDFIFLNNDQVYQFVVSEIGDLDYRRQSNEFEVSELLYETGIKNCQIGHSEFNGIDSYSFNGKCDPVATVFYLISRYEEYQNTERDEHGRYRHEDSYQFRFGLLEKPVADQLSKAILESKGVSLPEKLKKVELIPTFDIDNVYAYKLKKGIRRVGATARDLIKGNKKRIEERKAVDKGETDPYDTFDLIEQIARSNHRTVVFWLSGGDSSYDRNVDVLDPEHAMLIQRINNVCAVGLHPSYSSFNNSSKISAEKLRLEKAMKDKVVQSRFHYLHFTLPQSYRSLIQSGLYSDYSMGYAGRCGFRAGTSKPFLWYDLENEEVTKLQVFPFTYMDGTLNEYMKLSVDEAKAKIRSLFDEIAVTGGYMIGIWHNETIGDYNHWKGWKEVLLYNLTLDE